MFTIYVVMQSDLLFFD